MSKDYYEILNVRADESTENIKIAYRKLARLYHPDVAGNSEEAVQKFKEINEAYQILSNSTKRAEYDRAKKFYDYAKSTATSTQGTFYNSNPQKEKQEKGTQRSKFAFNWEEFLNKKNFANSFKNEKYKASKKGEDIYTDVEISVFEAKNGTTKTINMLQIQVCPVCKGKKHVNHSSCTHCNGKGEITNYKKFTVKIPANIENNSKIRLAGEGEKGKNGGVNGDLYLTIHIKENHNYQVEGLNIIKTIPISPFEAVLGCVVNVATIQGLVKIRINPNTRNGQKIKLAGYGIVQNNNVGDMIVCVEIQVPDILSDEEISLYRRLAEISTTNVRENLYDQ